MGEHAGRSSRGLGGTLVGFQRQPESQPPAAFTRRKHGSPLVELDGSLVLTKARCTWAAKPGDSRHCWPHTAGSLQRARSPARSLRSTWQPRQRHRPADLPWLQRKPFRPGSHRPLPRRRCSISSCANSWRDAVAANAARYAEEDIGRFLNTGAIDERHRAPVVGSTAALTLAGWRQFRLPEKALAARGAAFVARSVALATGGHCRGPARRRSCRSCLHRQRIRHTPIQHR